MARTRAPHRSRAADIPHHPPRTPGGRWLPLAVLVTIAVLVVFGLGRASVGDTAPPTAPSPRSAIPGVGPSRTVHGVPAGYAHTHAGALAAALNYTGVFSNPGVIFNPARVRQALAVVATPELAERTATAYSKAADRIAQTPLAQSIRSRAPAITLGVPVAYRILGSSRDRLTAQFWTVAVIGDLQGTAPHAIWGRPTVTFAWVKGDWQLVAARRRQTGPTPGLAPSAEPTDADAFVDELQGFRGFRYAP
jgi:hypothetical protein